MHFHFGNAARLARLHICHFDIDRALYNMKHTCTYWTTEPKRMTAVVGKTMP